MKSTKAIAVLALSVALAAPAAAQQSRAPDIPASHRPPPGMCRIWIDGVPPGQQPAPTDCATAVRNRPEHGRVIFGDDYVKKDSRTLPDIVKPFTQQPDQRRKRDSTAKPKKP